MNKWVVIITKKERERERENESLWKTWNKSRNVIPPKRGTYTEICSSFANDGNNDANNRTRKRFICLRRDINKENIGPVVSNTQKTTKCEDDQVLP